MPTYYVYDARTGAVVHRHEAVDATTGESLVCGQEDVLSLVDGSLPRDGLRVLEAPEAHPAERDQRGASLRVDVGTGELTTDGDV